jgi:hypothetical protein
VAAGAIPPPGSQHKIDKSKGDIARNDIDGIGID